ncbi:MFS transporter [Actinomyces ruminis]|uniref:MFS transporter n=1 Tax=Actinomyces ruminis TaxID=1937003 RepID=UPI00211E8D1A|nr:MFS transporter [Actinomyces ruminis]
MSILMAVGALAPMIAPVAGGAVLTVASWRVVFWCLVGFGIFMTTMAAVFVPETLPEQRRLHGNGMRRFLAGAGELVRHRRYLATCSPPPSPGSPCSPTSPPHPSCCRRSRG